MVCVCVCVSVCVRVRARVCVCVCESKNQICNLDIDAKLVNDETATLTYLCLILFRT